MARRRGEQCAVRRDKRGEKEGRGWGGEQYACRARGMWKFSARIDASIAVTKPCIHNSDQVSPLPYAYNMIDTPLTHPIQSVPIQRNPSYVSYMYTTLHLSQNQVPLVPCIQSILPTQEYEA